MIKLLMIGAILYGWYKMGLFEDRYLTYLDNRNKYIEKLMKEKKDEEKYS